ncbi:hypothetical protein AGDE_16374 [Angomonas deanei]|nr:hypothetical protein AGDE_16374 [Angomonas deanei]|eukprot:EPY17200.1 hypothetical protein AGDE_16374 [Angomonas deanei]
MNREYLAKHAPAMNSLSVFYDCAPYKDGPSPAEKLKQDKSELLAGWVGDGDDECDNVILTREVLHDGQLFLSWLEEVVEQSSLNREAEETLFNAGVGYVERHPELPLTNYLSFVKIFVGASAVRSVIEKDAASGGTKRVLDGADIGLRIIVGTKCDVSEGGRLFIPWYMDPNTLIVLLGEKEGPEELEI